ncbi:unnamed protein product [Closterium sp. NIES-64]|nr:unnamed protein product [Closterium sp. NIES-64]CAI5977723.1 unnamed protein product [Closterium sp. NIES-65]
MQQRISVEAVVLAMAVAETAEHSPSTALFAQPAPKTIDIEGILEEHNKARQEVGVPDLAWDDGVAATSQEWANELASKGCPLEHGGAEGLGQNLYWLSPARLTPEEDRGAVQSWVEEKADWTPSPIPDRCADGKMCGHYTQVVWHDTTHVGCASAQCPDGSGMWVYDYSPPGNFVGFLDCMPVKSAKEWVCGKSGQDSSRQ